MYINNQQIYKSNRLKSTNFTFPITSRGSYLNTRGFCIAKCTNVKKCPMKFWMRLCLKLSSQEGKNSVDPMVLYCMVNWLLFLPPRLHCYIQKCKLGYACSEPDLIPIWLATTPKFVWKFLIVHFTFMVMISKVLITRNEWTRLHTLL